MVNYGVTLDINPRKKLRISAIGFLNPAPLMWDFEHPPEMKRLALDYEIHRSMPSQCAAELAAGNADIGLIPIAAYATIPNLSIIPGCTIASLSHVRSIVLIVKSNVSLGDVRRVAADVDSRTSNAYAQILFRKFHGNDPEFISKQPDLDAMLTDCDAAILIGDPALLALEDRDARAARTGEPLEYFDLAEMWKHHTGAPWVSAFWAVRPEAIASARLDRDRVVADFIQSRDHGIAHVEDLVREWTPRLPISAETIRTYLSENIHYVLDENCIAGVELFFHYAAECGVLPPAPALRWL